MPEIVKQTLCTTHNIFHINEEFKTGQFKCINYIETVFFETLELSNYFLQEYDYISAPNFMSMFSRPPQISTTYHRRTVYVATWGPPSISDEKGKVKR